MHERAGRMHGRMRDLIVAELAGEHEDLDAAGPARGRSGWHSGIHSNVRFAAWIPASRATPSTSPLPIEPARTAAAVAGAIAILPLAIAVRTVSGFAPTSTMWAAPLSSKWVSVGVVVF